MTNRIILKRPKGNGRVSINENQLENFLAQGYSKHVEPVEESPIVAAIRQLGEGDFNKSNGKPKVDAIEDILGHQISANERDDAWSEYSAQ